MSWGYCALLSRRGAMGAIVGSVAAAGAGRSDPPAVGEMAGKRDPDDFAWYAGLRRLVAGAPSISSSRRGEFSQRSPICRRPNARR